MNPVHTDIGFWRYAASARSEVWAALRRESFRGVAAGLLRDGRPDVPGRVRIPPASKTSGRACPRSRQPCGTAQPSG